MQEFKLDYKLPSNYTSAGHVSIKEIEKQVDNVDNKLPKLFTPLQIKNLTLKNRIVVSPMCTYSSKDGIFNDWHFSHYTGFVKGGAGLIVIEATGVVPEGRITYGCTGIYTDDHIKGLKRIVDFANQFDSRVGIQIAHAGRKGSAHPPFLEGAKNSHISIKKDDPSGNGWQVYGPSAIPWNNDMETPIEMTIKDIEYAIDSFKQAAIRCLKAGISLIEIHGAHGYLISSFLSSTSNKRTDQYGGSFEGRSRLLVEIVKAVRSVWTDEKPLAVRISCDEWITENSGWTIEDSIKLAQLLESLGVDLLDASSGGNNKDQKIVPGPLYQVPFADAIKKSVFNRSGKLLVSAVGIINTAVEAESVLQSNNLDLIFIGRAFLRNPFLPVEFAQQLNLNIDFIIQYQQARPFLTTSFFKLIEKDL